MGRVDDAALHALEPGRTRRGDQARPDPCSRLQSSPMRYLTAAGFGVLAGIATAILWIVVQFVLPLAGPLFLSRIGATQSGSGGASAMIGSGSDPSGGTARTRRRLCLDALEAIDTRVAHIGRTSNCARLRASRYGRQPLRLHPCAKSTLVSADLLVRIPLAGTPAELAQA